MGICFAPGARNSASLLPAKMDATGMESVILGESAGVTREEAARIAS